MYYIQYKTRNTICSAAEAAEKRDAVVFLLLCAYVPFGERLIETYYIPYSVHNSHFARCFIFDQNEAHVQCVYTQPYYMNVQSVCAYCTHHNHANCTIMFFAIRSPVATSAQLQDVRKTAKISVCSRIYYSWYSVQ